MSDKKARNSSSKIISDYYSGVFAPDADQRIKNKFISWFLDEQNSQDKESALKSLWEMESGESDQEKAAAVREIIAEIERRGGFTKNAKGKAGSISLRRAVMRIAAVVVPLAIATGVYFFYQNENLPVDYFAEYNVETGSTSVVTLKDSTRVWLNSESSLTFDLNTEGERVANLEGEGYFSVAADEKRPFIVKCDDLTLRVIGTEFNVENYDDLSLTTVTLKNGKLSVKTSDGQIFELQPNEQFAYNKHSQTGELIKLSEQDLERSLEWREGKLVCVRMTLPEILRSVERKYGLKIEVSPEVRFTSETYVIEFLASDTPDFVLKWLSTLDTNFKYMIEGDKVFILK